MKALVYTIVILMGLNLNAGVGNFGKYVCQEYDRTTEKLLQKTVVLVQAGQAVDKLDENGHYIAMEAPYLLEVYEGINFFPIHSVRGTVISEDVNFHFTSEDGTIGFSMYLDEMEESGLSVNNQQSYYSCK